MDLRTITTTFAASLLVSSLALAGPKTVSRPVPAPAVLTADEQYCVQLGGIALAMARGRDSGVPRSAMLKVIRESLRAQKGQQVNEQILERLIRTVFEAYSLTPVYFQQQTEHYCLDALTAQTP